MFLVLYIGTFCAVGKSRKARRSKKGHLSSKKEEKALEKSEPAQDEVYEISSGDEDCSRGMRSMISSNINALILPAGLILSKQLLIYGHYTYSVALLATKV